MDETPNAHFERLTKNELALNVVKTSIRWATWSCVDELYTKISSKNTMTNLRRYGWKMEFIAAWKVDGAFVKPKGITRNSKCPS